jgi:predicted TPR repeat methyltransferase
MSTSTAGSCITRPHTDGPRSISGCGTSVLAANLAPHFARVTGIDADEGMAAAARARLAGNPRVSILRLGFAEFAPVAGDGGVDLITMVAVLNHLDLGGTLARIPAVLAARSAAPLGARRRITAPH